MKILIALLLSGFLIGVAFAEPSLSELQAQLDAVKAKRQAAVADYRRGEAMEEAAKALKENAILKDSAFEAQEKALMAQIQAQQKAESKK